MAVHALLAAAFVFAPEPETRALGLEDAIEVMVIDASAFQPAAPMRPEPVELDDAEPETLVWEEPEDDPVPEPEPTEKPVEQAPVAEIKEPDVVIPSPVVKPKPKPKPVLVKTQPKPPTVTARPASRLVSARVGTQSGRADQAARYLEKLSARLRRFLIYPTSAKRRREEGRVMVHVTLSSEGAIVAQAIAKTSGSKRLDSAAMALVAKAAPFGTPPLRSGQTQFSAQVPVRYRLTD